MHREGDEVGLGVCGKKSTVGRYVGHQETARPEHFHEPHKWMRHALGWILLYVECQAATMRRKRAAVNKKAGAGDSHAAPSIEQVVLGRHEATSIGRGRSVPPFCSFHFIVSSAHHQQERERAFQCHACRLPPPRTREIHLYNGRGGRKGERESHSNHPPAHSLRSACALPVALSPLASPLST